LELTVTTRGSWPADRAEQQAGEREVAQVVGRELGLEALGGEPAGRVHHPGVVDEHVHRDPVRQDRRGERPYRVQVGEVQHAEFDGGARLRGLDPGHSVEAFRLAAGGQHDPAAMGRQLAGGLESQAAIAAGDDEGAAGLISDPVRGPEHTTGTARAAFLSGPSVRRSGSRRAER
jgi:hypothetical protein